MRHLPIIVAAALGCSPAAVALQDAPPPPAPGETVIVALSTGDAIRAKLVASEPDSVIVEHPVLGRMTISRKAIASMSLAPAAKADDAPGSTDATRVRMEEQPAANDASDAPRPQANVNPGDDAAKAGAAPPPPPVPSPWKLLFDGNANYVSAANKQMDFRVAAAAVYEVKDVDKWSNNAEYFFKLVDGSTTDNNLLVTSTYDRRFVSNPKWLWFVKGQAQWAPLESYEQRLSGWGGLGYEFLTLPPAKLLGKLGAGYTYEFGDQNDGQPELYAQLDWEWAITDSQALVGSYWIAPSFEDFTDYLMLFRTEWTMKMADIPGLKLLGGVRWQYQSKVVPADALQNDIRLYAGLRYEI